MGKLNCNDYAHSLEVGNTRDLLLDSEKIPQIGKIGLVAVATQIPIIAVAHYYGATYGYNDKLATYITRLCQFYDITEVIHFKDMNK